MCNNKCVSCGEIVPEGRMVCSSCEASVVKIGSILQSQNASKERASRAYGESEYLEYEYREWFNKRYANWNKEDIVIDFIKNILNIDLYTWQEEAIKMFCKKE